MMTSRMPQPSAPNSLRRFFDRVVHRSFGAPPPRDAPPADYVSALLTRFARTETLYPAGALPGQRLESVVDLLLEIRRAWDADSPHFNPVRERELRRHIGDYTLFMIGLFRERVEHLSSTLLFSREGLFVYCLLYQHKRMFSCREARLFRA